jgi:hypothetical protein
MGQILDTTNFCVTLLLFVNFLQIGRASPVVSTHDLATISEVRLRRAMTLKLSHKGFIVIAISDCSVMINGTNTNLKSGEYREISSGESLELAPTKATAPRLLLVDIVASSQALTIEATKLSPHQELEDASDRNETLLIALNNMQLRDERDLAEEGEPCKPSLPKVIRLNSGHSVWLKPGMHRVRNTGNSTASFVTVEW